MHKKTSTLDQSLSKKMTLLEMVGMGSDELKEHVMKENGEVSSEDVKVLLTAVQNLKKGVVERLKNG